MCVCVYRFCLSFVMVMVGNGGDGMRDVVSQSVGSVGQSVSDSGVSQ